MRWQKVLAFGYLVGLAAIIFLAIVTTAIVIKQVVDPMLLEPPFIAHAR